MPNIKSAKKRLRQSLDRRERNRARRSILRNLLRNVRQLIDAGNVAEATEQFRLLSKKLDQGAAHNIIHANSAARLKSRLSRRLKAAKQPAA